MLKSNSVSLEFFLLMLKAQRDYKKEYADYHSLPEQKKRRVGRNYARRKFIREGKAKLGDGKDIDHIDFDTTNNDDSKNN